MNYKVKYIIIYFLSGVNSFLYILYVVCPDKTTKFFSVIRGNAKRVIGGVALCQGVQTFTPLPPCVNRN